MIHTPPGPVGNEKMVPLVQGSPKTNKQSVFFRMGEEKLLNTMYRSRVKGTNKAGNLFQHEGREQNSVSGTGCLMCPK